MVMDDTLELMARHKIYKCLFENPGLHFRELSRRLNMPSSTLKYHLIYLKKRQLIIEKTESGYVRYYIINKIGFKDKELINLLRNNTVRHIVLLFYSELAVSNKDISSLLNLHPNTVDFHLKKLLDLNIIEPAEVCDDTVVSSVGTIIENSPVGREKIYRFKNPRLMWNLLVTYQDSFLDDLTKDILEIVSYGSQVHKYKRHKSFNSRFDFVVDLIFEIFPHPYYG